MIPLKEHIYIYKIYDFEMFFQNITTKNDFAKPDF